MGEGGYRQINKSFNACAFDEYLDGVLARLPVLSDVQQLTPRVLRVLGQNPGKVSLALGEAHLAGSLTKLQFTLQGTNTYIVGTAARRLIVDTAQGFHEWADAIDETMKSHNTRLSHILLTHWHGDHTGGVPDLIRLYPELDDAIFKNSPDCGQRPIHDGDVFRVEGATVRAVHSPGHSHDHMCFILEEENAMFTGDNILGHGTSVVEELGEFMDTLTMLLGQGCAVGYPAHGDVVKNLPSKIKGELAQRAARETRCLYALQKAQREQRNESALAGLTVQELVLQQHGPRMDPELQRLALEPHTDEILRKLAADGKVAFHMRKGVKRWFMVGAS